MGLVASVGIERLMVPRPALDRPLAAWALHTGSWLAVFGGFVLLLGRPWFAAAAVSAFMLFLVLVNNAKVQALREPFVFQDYEYFTDAIRHPRLYIPFLGWGKAVVALLGFVLAVTAGLGLEGVPGNRFIVAGQLGGVGVVIVVGSMLLVVGCRWRPQVVFEVNHDVSALGLAASLWCYALAARRLPAVASPFDFLPARREAADLPHLIAVQSESFFDPRPLYEGVRRDILAEFDRLKSSAILHGRLAVPAWGANTVRTEFAFLSGLDEPVLGAHRFNPFHAVTRGWDVPTLASRLKRLGYRTVCIHPYPASFYQRDSVYPRLGFDEFIDLQSFTGARRCGPYVCDTAVASMIADILDQASSPLFLFAITMENHGPLHLEKAGREDVAELYTEPPLKGCDDLTIYLRHLRNADSMIRVLREQLNRCGHPAGLCWFGDHVPIMPGVYDALGAPCGDTEFLIWSNAADGPPEEKRLAAHQLAVDWLRAMKLVGI
ncbi:MAG TPA: LTA synthase family protein [Xanthomonadales bacterium]|nr:LTA synthase family protein [Xanthomonadales bacterium]